MTRALKKVLAVSFAALMGVACLAGCAGGGSATSSSSASQEPSTSSASSQASSSSSEQSSEAAESDELTIGEEVEGALDVLFLNDTGAEITSFGIVPGAAADETVELMAADATWPVAKEARVFAEAASGDLLTLTFTSGGVQYQLHDVDFGALDEASIMLEDDVAYLSFDQDGNAMSTLQQEYDIAHPAAVEDQVVDEAVEQGADEAVDEGAAYEEPAYEEPVADEEPTVTYYEEDPAVDEAPDQSEDACVTDIVLN